jgi:hypothetical protein
LRKRPPFRILGDALANTRKVATVDYQTFRPRLKFVSFLFLPFCRVDRPASFMQRLEAKQPGYVFHTQEYNDLSQQPIFSGFLK